MREDSNHISRVLVCAYACSHGRGSEELVGWDTATQLAERGHQVVVLTQTKERIHAEARLNELNIHPRPTFEVCDIRPRWAMLFEKMGKIGVDLAYLTWLLKARRTVAFLHEVYSFTSSQHVTYARYWMPSPLSVIPVPFVWGPVGGGESIPKALRPSFSLKGRIFEWVRDAMRWTGEKFKWTRHNARYSSVALANTRETGHKMRLMGARNVRIINSAALSGKDLDRLAAPAKRCDQITFASIGRLIEWKGFQLGLEAFAEACLSEARYLIIGSGPFEDHLKSLAERLGVSHLVEFIQAVPRADLFKIIRTSHALIHPSMHESGGYVCLEMMAAGNPVICLDAGGPSLFVTNDCGFVASTFTRHQAIAEMASAMRVISGNPALCDELGHVGRQRVASLFSMTTKSDQLSQFHYDLLKFGEIESGPASPGNAPRLREDHPPRRSLGRQSGTTGKAKRTV